MVDHTLFLILIHTVCLYVSYSASPGVHNIHCNKITELQLITERCIHKFCCNVKIHWDFSSTNQFSDFLQKLLLNCLQTRLSVICAASGLELLTIQIWNQPNESALWRVNYMNIRRASPNAASALPKLTSNLPKDQVAHKIYMHP